MKFYQICLGAALAAALSCGTVHAEDTINIADVIELSGGGASSGTQWRDAVEMAKDEINAGGGILGKQVVVTHYDSRTDPSVSRAQVQKALDGNPYAVLGTIYSSSTNVNMLLTQRAEIPQFTGSQAPDITTKGNDYIFRANMGAQMSMPKIALYLGKIGAKRVSIVWANDAFGKGGRDAFVAQMGKSGIEIVNDVSTEVNQADFATDVLAANKSEPDAIFVYLHEDESARFLKSARSIGVKAPLIGDTTLTSAKVIELAGEAANGALGYVPLSADAPSELVQQFKKKFESRFGYTPAHAAMSGYISMYVIKTVTKQTGEVDSKKLAAKLHGLTITTQEEPGVLIDAKWDEHGDVDRPSYLVEVKDGKQIVTETIPAAFQK